MNVAVILEKRRVQWAELESLCDAMEARGKTDRAGGAQHRGAAGISRFATLYRAACADFGQVHGRSFNGRWCHTSGLCRPSRGSDSRFL